MGISFNTHFSYANQTYQQYPTKGMSIGTSIGASISTSKNRVDSTFSSDALYKTSSGVKQIKTEQMRKKLNELHKEKKDTDNPFQVTNKENLENLLASGSVSKSDKKVNYKKYKYNPMEVSNKILKAKNSLSASQAMRSARRKVSEIRRKLASKEGDSDELELALSHALRMQNVAEKKKHNLEQEEMIQRTQSSDENRDKLDETKEDLRQEMVFQAEDEVAEAEDEIYEARDEAVIEAAEAMEENPEAMSDLTDDIYEQISELGDELLDELDDTMEMLEDMEVLDPHMSKEQFEKVKLKHRTAEEREILKANIEYLKSCLKLSQAHQSSDSLGKSVSSSFSLGGGFTQTLSSVAVSVPSAEASVSIDVSA